MNLSDVFSVNLNGNLHLEQVHLPELSTDQFDKKMLFIFYYLSYILSKLRNQKFIFAQEHEISPSAHSCSFNSIKVIV